jgi:hypothetical protein
MYGALESTLPWWIAGPILGFVIVSLLGLADNRFAFDCQGFARRAGGAACE